MTAARTCGILIALAVVALAVVFLRSEQTRFAADTLRLERESIALRRQLWRLQTGVARLRSPERVRQSLEWFDVGLALAEPRRTEGGRVFTP